MTRREDPNGLGGGEGIELAVDPGRRHEPRRDRADERVEQPHQRLAAHRGELALRAAHPLVGLVERQGSPFENAIAIRLVRLIGIQQDRLDRRHGLDGGRRAPLGDQAASRLRVRLGHQRGDPELVDPVAGLRLAPAQRRRSAPPRELVHLRLQLAGERSTLLDAPGKSVELAQPRKLALQQEPLAFERAGQIEEGLGTIHQRPVETRHAGSLDQVFGRPVQAAAAGHRHQCLDQDRALADVPGHGIAGLEPVHGGVVAVFQDGDPGPQGHEVGQRPHLLDLVDHQVEALGPRVELPIAVPAAGASSASPRARRLRSSQARARSNGIAESGPLNHSDMASSSVRPSGPAFRSSARDRRWTSISMAR